MSELPGNDAEKKLDWMYRDASQIVDREEYLLGRKIDKQFENSLQPPDKSQECLPPSIFSRGSTESQVDIARKLQEDPLYLIKKKEIECREQLLKNPRKMKQLQEMIARQQAAAEKLKKKQTKKRKKKELDALLVKKCRQIFGEDGTKKLADLDDSDSYSSDSSSSETDSSVSKRKKKKKKMSRNLDRKLALKYKQVLGNMDAKGLADIDSTSESSSEDMRGKNAQRKKERSSRRSSHKRQKLDSNTRIKKGDDQRQRYSSSEDRKKSSSEERDSKRKSYKERKEFSSRNKKRNEDVSRNQNKSDDKNERRRRSLSSEGTDYCKKQMSKSKEILNKDKAGNSKHNSYRRLDSREKSNKKVRESSEQNYRKNKSARKSFEREKINRSNKCEQKSKRESQSYSEEKESSPSSYGSSNKYKNRHKQIEVKRKVTNKFQSGSSSDYDSKEELQRMNSKQNMSKQKKESSNNSSLESSSEENSQPLKKQYGLVLPANYVPKEQVTQDIKPTIKKEDEPSKPFRNDRVKLTDKEKKRKLKEMLENAKWRDEQRDRNIKAFKEKEKAEKDDYVYNEDFMRKQMAIAVSQGTVESRVKSNINTIQRSGSSMNEHFARRK